MANISVTNTFSNSITADASQVNTNFTDIINGTSDGTKDFSISALTVGGTATLNGAVTLGNATGDDITVTGSLASSIPIKTTYSYDIGSATIGLRSLYFGDAGSAARSTRVIGATVASSWTMTLPTGVPTAARYRMESDASGVTSWQPVRRSISDAQNLSLAGAVAASALTITLNDAGGSALSATNPCDIVFRSATAATGTAITRSLTSSPTLTVSSGSTLGTVSGAQAYLYVYALDSAGTVELAVSRCLYSDYTIQTTTAEGGAGAADSNAALYSTTARSNVAIRLIGRISSTQATAGTWATAVSEISLANSQMIEEFVIAALYTVSGAVASDTTQPIDYSVLGYDTLNCVTTGSSWKFTSPISDYYDITGMGSTDNAIAANLTVYKNGSASAVLCGQNNIINTNGSATLYLAKTDYVDLRHSASRNTGSIDKIYIRRSGR